MNNLDPHRPGHQRRDQPGDGEGRGADERGYGGLVRLAVTMVHRMRLIG